MKRNRNGLSNLEGIGAFVGGLLGAAYGVTLNLVLFGLVPNQMLSDLQLLDISLANGAIRTTISGFIMGAVLGTILATGGASLVAAEIRIRIPITTSIAYGAFSGGIFGIFLYMGGLWLYSYVTKNPSPSALHHVIITAIVGIIIGIAFYSEEIWSNIMSGESNNNKR